MRESIVPAMCLFACAIGLAALSGCPDRKGCEPSCAGLACGSDGCGGSCGTCDAPPGDICLDGQTLGQPDALGQCLAGVCDYPLTAVACSDDLICTGTETCQAGQCVASGPVDCGAPPACMSVACEEPAGHCVLSDLPDGSSCDDGDACTVGDTCAAGACASGVDQCTDQPVVVAVYMVADNDLDEYMVVDWQEMEAAGVDQFDWLRVIILIDRHAQSEWSDTRLYEIHSGSSQELDAPNLGLTVAGQEELNLADGMTLVRFMQDVRQLAGEDAQIFLLLSDHGDGWWRRAPAGGAPGTTRGCCYDESAGDDYLSNEELHQALAGETLALLGFDACLQGMAEVAYALRGDASVLVASPELEGGWGWDYTALLSQFGQGDDRSAQTFGVIAVDTYMDVALAENDHVATGAVYDLTRLDALAVAATDMALAMRAYSWTGLLDLCDQLDWYGCEGQQCEDNTDLAQLASLLQAADAPAAATYAALLSALDSAVLYERHSSGHPDAGGLAVYFPCWYEAWAEYADTAWSLDTGWYTMLTDY